MDPRTRLHLEAALTGEALAALRYNLFAERAEVEGRPEVATLFRTIGRQERSEHFAEIAELLGLVGTTRQNLEMAISGEVVEHHRLYPTYAAEARHAGDEPAAERFIELGGDEHRHANLLRQALGEMEAVPAGVL